MQEALKGSVPLFDAASDFLILHVVPGITYSSSFSFLVTHSSWIDPFNKYDLLDVGDRVGLGL